MALIHTPCIIIGKYLAHVSTFSESVRLLCDTGPQLVIFVWRHHLYVIYENFTFGEKVFCLGAIFKFKKNCGFVDISDRPTGTGLGGNFV